MFGLAQIGAWRGFPLCAGVVVVARRALGVDVQLEIVKMVDSRGLPASLNIEICLILLVRETGKAQDASRVGSGWISAELAYHGVQEHFCLFETHAFHLPDDLEFS